MVAHLEGPASRSARVRDGSGGMPDPELLRRLLRAKDRMDAASHEEWPVRRLARVSGVSEAHFARSFKEAFGLPPHRYLLTVRIERAKALLRDTDLSISEIAFVTGAQEPRHLRSNVPRRHRREPGRSPRAREGHGARPAGRARLLPARRPPARPHDRSFGEATAGGAR
ncbi:MAG: helix-turn-helix transcriptional regulator [Sandaracinaceae bacterium]|nr:helix-turn-helix transcriptional regulator [Sandaracinaceae bacterium]